VSGGTAETARAMTAGAALAAEAATLRAFVDVMLPGDDLFPPASAVGAHGWLADRLRERHGPDSVGLLAAAIERYGQDVVERGEEAPTPLPPPPTAGEGEPSGGFAALGREAQVEAVRRFEAAEPERFVEMRWILTYGYYQSPHVVRAVRALGFAYNDAPQPLGYAMEPFDPARDAPAGPRGGYKATAEITRVDLRPVGEQAVVRKAEVGL